MGSEDPIVPAAVMHEAADLIPESEVVVVPDAGHSTYFEKPAAFNRLVLDFLARRSRDQFTQSNEAAALTSPAPL
ncbi:hypothetical protein HK414_06615 [Ramlibacter terrae]|uniref:Peptidase S33 tripeptidyl aminopeptidase-like C-terminal domain-containing protein n=1 Tax=Ramlibacter terrae TaxID=2732511 RepID=A0ABX6P2P6_9BURK|nr:hypothetical protein HK414_06615 [Ramlibacter terrae]